MLLCSFLQKVERIKFCYSPWPEEGIEFTTLWCRWISVSCKEWKFQLRDFRQPWVDIRELQLWGKLVGAEQEATKRGKSAVKMFAK